MAANPKQKNETIVSFILDGKEILSSGEETILQAAKRQNIEIPHLCYKDGYRSDGNCRACVVEIEGERVLAPSCCRKPTEGMKVNSTNTYGMNSGTMPKGYEFRHQRALNSDTKELTLSRRRRTAAHRIRFRF